MKVLSFGGGNQTTALAVLWAKGIIDVDVAAFADTGDETDATYAHIETVRRWLAGYGKTIETVRAAKLPTLREYVKERSTPIPVILDAGIGHRQCTSRWKIEPVQKLAKTLAAGAHVYMIVGISVDEPWRIKQAPEPWITREYPLVERRITKAGCREIAAAAGLPEAPKSACFYCPLQSMDRWRWLEAEEPAKFADAVELEDVINARRSAKGQPPAYMTSARIPLRQVRTAGSMLPGLFGNECEGACDV